MCVFVGLFLVCLFVWFLWCACLFVCVRAWLVDCLFVCLFACLFVC